jgi:hypothetical protein
MTAGPTRPVRTRSELEALARSMVAKAIEDGETDALNEALHAHVLRGLRSRGLSFVSPKKEREAAAAAPAISCHSMRTVK